MEKTLLKKIIIPMVVITLSVGAVILQSASVHSATFSATEEITDSGTDYLWDPDTGNYIIPYTWYDLTFTATNDGYDDIVEFAIGNSDGTNAWLDWGTENTLSTGTMAYKDAETGQWSTYVSGYRVDGSWVSGYQRDLVWMEDSNSGFAEYDKAFLFTSWTKVRDGDPDTDHYNGFIENGLTFGYNGTTLAGPQSPVAAFSLNSGTINGGEATVVPIPGALWLFASGLIGFVGLRRKNN